MCGRFTLFEADKVLSREFGVSGIPALSPRYNIAPSQNVAAVRTTLTGRGREIALVRGVFARGKVVAAICHGGWMLVSADVLRGRKATCFFAIKDDLVNAGARYEDREVVRDGNLVTSRKPEDLPAFCRTILQALSGAKT